MRVDKAREIGIRLAQSVTTDVPVPGDYDGDGKADIAVWRPSDGIWYVRPSSAPGTSTSTQFGVPTDVPVVGDWTGSGTAKLGVFRNSDWFLDLNGNGVWDGCGVDRCITGWGAPSRTAADGSA
jgi:hypothetical protein